MREKHSKAKDKNDHSDPSLVDATANNLVIVWMEVLKGLLGIFFYLFPRIAGEMMTDGVVFTSRSPKTQFQRQDWESLPNI